MANKRQLKKRISQVCGDLAADILLASHFKGVDRAKVEQIVGEIATLQETARARATFAFDKAVKDFDSRAAYNKARAAYNRAAYGRLKADFLTRATEVVKEMNAAIPADVREAVDSL